MTTPTRPDPAAELRAAAQLLRESVAAARENMRANTFWHCYPPETAWRDGLVNGFGGAGAEYAALMHPGVGELLADWLDGAADEMTAVDGTEYAASEYPSWMAALAVARALLGSQP